MACLLVAGLFGPAEAWARNGKVWQALYRDAECADLCPLNGGRLRDGICTCYAALPGMDTIRALPGPRPLPTTTSGSGGGGPDTGVSDSAPPPPTVSDPRRAACHEQCNAAPAAVPMDGILHDDLSCECRVRATSASGATSPPVASEASCRAQGRYYQPYLRACGPCPIGKIMRCGRCGCPPHFTDLGQGRSCACGAGRHLGQYSGGLTCLSNNPVTASLELQELTHAGPAGDPRECGCPSH